MRTSETIRAEFGAPDFKQIDVWKLSEAVSLWGARYRGHAMAVQQIEAVALIAAGARKSDEEPARIPFSASLE